MAQPWNIVVLIVVFFPESIFFFVFFFFSFLHLTCSPSTTRIITQNSIIPLLWCSLLSITSLYFFFFFYTWPSSSAQLWQALPLLQHQFLRYFSSRENQQPVSQMRSKSPLTYDTYLLFLIILAYPLSVLRIFEDGRKQPALQYLRRLYTIHT